MKALAPPVPVSKVSTAMPPSPILTERVRAALAPIARVTEKKMFGGITFMVNGKMCISVGKRRLMCRIDPVLHDKMVARKGVQAVRMKGRVYRGFVHVDQDAVASKRSLMSWMRLCLDFNQRTRSSRARKRG